MKLSSKPIESELLNMIRGEILKNTFEGGECKIDAENVNAYSFEHKGAFYSVDIEIKGILVLGGGFLNGGELSITCFDDEANEMPIELGVSLERIISNVESIIKDL